MSNLGKSGQAMTLEKNNNNTSAPTALICMSGGSETCLLYLKSRLASNHKTTHVILIGATWTGAGREGFNAWTDILSDAIEDGTKILVVNDASVLDLAPKRFTAPGTGSYTRGDVPFDYPNGGSVLCHHGDNCDPNLKIGANNSPALIESVFNFIEAGEWTWNP